VVTRFGVDINTGTVVRPVADVAIAEIVMTFVSADRFGSDVTDVQDRKALARDVTG